MTESRKEMNIFTEIEKTSKERQAELFAAYGKAFLNAVAEIEKTRAKYRKGA